MATITYIVQAINRASSVFNDVADSAAKAAAAEDKLTQTSLNLARAESLQMAATNRATSSLKDLRTAALGAAAAVAATSAAANAGTPAVNRLYLGWFGLFGLFRGKTALFGGVGPAILSQIRNWHLYADVIAEVLAVVIPATIALTAFGVVGSDVVRDMSTRLNQVAIAAHATNQQIYPMTGGFDRLAKAIRPQVWQIYGEALVLAGHSADSLTHILTGTGDALDRLAARAEVALGSGGIGYIASHAASDVAKLGDVVGNVFGTLGNLFRSMPGIAEVLLTALDNVTRAVENFTSSTTVQGILRWGLAFHGAAIYIGLLATGIAKLMPMLLGLASSALATGAGLLGKLGSAGAKAGVQLAGFSIFAERAAALPWGWIAVAVAALGFFIYRLATAKDAFGQFVDALNTRLGNTSAVNGISNIQKAMQALNAQLATYGVLTKISLPATTSSSVSITGAQTIQRNAAVSIPAVALTSLPAGEHIGIPKGGAAAGFVGPTTQGYAGLAGANPYNIGLAQQYLAEQKKLRDETTLYNARLQSLGHTYGSVYAAQSILQLSGVKLNDFLSKNANTWAQVQARLAATIDAYKALGETTQEANNNIQVQAALTTDQAKAVQQLNQAWDQYISNLTGAQSSFDTFAQGLSVLNNGSYNFTLRLGKLSEAVKGQVAPIDQLSQSGIALNQAFTQQVQSANQLFDSWRTAGIGGVEFAKGVKAVVANLLPLAAGSSEATAMITGLADAAGYTGPPLIRNLIDWLGGADTSLQAIKQVSDDATIEMGLLTTAMQGQGAYIANQLIGDLNAAIFKYDGVYTAVQNYGQALAEFGPKSKQASNAADVLSLSIVKGGIAAGLSTEQIAAYIAKVEGIPLSQATTITVQDQEALTATSNVQYALSLIHDKTVTVTVKTFYASPIAPGGSTYRSQVPTGAASGAYIRQGTTATADDVLARVSKGELIVPANMVASGMVNHLRGRIPGFASGGFPMAGSAWNWPDDTTVHVNVTGQKTESEKLLAVIADLIDELTSVTSAVPGATAAALAGSNAGRSGAYGAMYSTRG